MPSLPKRSDADGDGDVDASGQTGQRYQTRQMRHHPSTFSTERVEDAKVVVECFFGCQNGGRFLLAVVKETVYDVKVEISMTYS